MNTAAEAESTTDIFIETLRKVDVEIESAIETLEILSDSETLKAIEEGLQDIKAGRVIRFEDFLKKNTSMKYNLLISHKFDRDFSRLERTLQGRVV